MVNRNETCDACDVATEELYGMPLVLQVAEQHIAVACGPCFERLTGAEPRRQAEGAAAASTSGAP